MLSPVIQELPALTVVGLEARFRSIMSPEPEPVIPRLWDRFIARFEEIPHRLPEGTYGIVSRLPESEQTHPHEMLYLAGAPVSQVDKLPAGMIVREIPASTWGIFTHTGPIQRIGETLDFIYREWLPASGYRLTGLPDVELYDARFNCSAEDSQMEYRLSVTPR